MNYRSERETFTIRAGRQYAAACGLTLLGTFDDTLAGDLARLRMRERIRREFPGISPDAIDTLIEELLTP